MFNNQPTQVLITLHENDKAALSEILHAAVHWSSHFNLITGNDGPYPTATICFDGINALTYICSSGIMASVEIGEGCLFALDSTVIEAKSVAIYNNGQVMDARFIAPSGQAFVELAHAYCAMMDNTYRPSPRAIPRDKSFGFMDLSDNRRSSGTRRRRTRDSLLSGAGDTHGFFGNTYPHPSRFPDITRQVDHDVKIILKDNEAFLSIDGEDADLLERTVVEGGRVFKFHHTTLNCTTERSINYALGKANLNSAWLDSENNIINIVVPDGSNEVDAADVLTFDIRLDINPEDNDAPVVVLEDKDGDLYPHLAEEHEDGYYYQSDLLRGLTTENIHDLTESAKRNGFEVTYDSEVGSIQLANSITWKDAATSLNKQEEVIPELEIKNNQILLGGVAAQVLEIGDREFEIIFDQDLPMNKHDYTSTLRGLLLGRRTKGFNSSWNVTHANVLVVRLEVGDKSKSVKTMRAAVEDSKLS